MSKLVPVSTLPLIPEAITLLQKIASGEPRGRGEKVKQLTALYYAEHDPFHNWLLHLVKNWGDQPVVRQILFFHYLHKEPLVKEFLWHCVYPGIKQQRQYRWKEIEIRFFLQQAGLTESEQNRSLKFLEKALSELKILTIQAGEKFIEYQRPAVEAVAYAFYAEYGGGFEEAKRFDLKNPPFDQILEQAAFPAYFLIDPRTVQMMLEACRIKNYISLEARGGLNQYALIHQDLPGLMEFWFKEVMLNVDSSPGSTARTSRNCHYDG